MNSSEVKSSENDLPEELKFKTHRLLCRYLAAALTLAMLPAGEMWSVVTLSPRKSKAWAFSIDWGAGKSSPWGVKMFKRKRVRCEGHRSFTYMRRQKRSPQRSKDSPVCWRKVASGCTWTCDPTGKPKSLDFQCCSKTCSLSGRKKKKKTTLVNIYSLQFREEKVHVSSPNLHPCPEILKDRGDDRVLFNLSDLLSGRPDITKIHLLTLWCQTWAWKFNTFPPQK